MGVHTHTGRLLETNPLSPASVPLCQCSFPKRRRTLLARRLPLPRPARRWRRCCCWRWRRAAALAPAEPVVLVRGRRACTLVLRRQERLLPKVAGLGCPAARGRLGCKGVVRGRHRRCVCCKWVWLVAGCRQGWAAAVWQGCRCLQVSRRKAAHASTALPPSPAQEAGGKWPVVGGVRHGCRCRAPACPPSPSPAFF